jgi:hypothetical protein
MSSLNALPIGSQQQRGYTFGDIWHAASTERHFDYSFWLTVSIDILAENCGRYIGNCLVCLAAVIIFGISSCGFLIVIPLVARPGSVWFYFNIVWGKYVVSSQ